MPSVARVKQALRYTINMNTSSHFAVRSSRVITPTGQRPALVRIADGVITEVADYAANCPEPVQDLGDLVLLPGLIDAHVHFNEPGRTEWEGIASGSAAAAAGGVTTVVDMPLNSSPVTTTLAALEAKRKVAEEKSHIDFGCYAGLVPGCETELPKLIAAGVLGVKAFLCHSGIDDFPAATDLELRYAMPLLAAAELPLLVHAELTREMPPLANPRRYANYLASRPPAFEQRAIAMVIDLVRETRCRSHIVHLADADSLPMIIAAKGDGLPLTVETCPHYLTFAAEEVADGATQFKCAPPIRAASHRERLWQALGDGVIDFIASDHSPCPLDMKSLDTGRFDTAWGGISSVQLSLPIVWTGARQRGYSLEKVANWLCHAPAKFLGIAAGIRPGAPANLVAFAPDELLIVHGDELLHRHPLTPYDDREFFGVVKQTWVHGRAPQAGGGRLL
jgi:allantoinase